MEKMTDLHDLLKHEIKDLYSAEEQIIEAMPQMIEKANNPQLKQALERHLRITEGQLKRLEQVQELMDQDHHEIAERKNSGLFARLMRRPSQESETGSGEEKCLGMEGLIKESKKVLAEEMEASVLDAAIIACAQKIEHYEICGYGTARAYARELDMGKIAELLEQTLNEENEADDRLTDMAVGKVNKEAEMGDTRRASRSSASSSASRGSSRTPAPSTSRSRAGAALAASNSRSGSASTGRDASRTSRTTSSSGRSGASTSGRSTSRTKAATKTSSRGGSAAPAGKASSARSTSKSSGRSTSTSKTRTATASRTKKAASKVAGKVASKTAAAKGGRSSSTSRTASKSPGRGSSNGRSSGRR